MYYVCCAGPDDRTVEYRTLVARLSVFITLGRHSQAHSLLSCARQTHGRLYSYIGIYTVLLVCQGSSGRQIAHTEDPTTGVSGNETSAKAERKKLVYTAYIRACVRYGTRYAVYTPIHVRVSLRGSNTYTNLTESIRKTAKQKTDD